MLDAVFGNRMMPREPAYPNPGLVFDRYLRIWQSRSKLVTERGGVLGRFVEEYSTLGRTLGPLLGETHHRLEQLTSHQRSFVTAERLVTGLGASHPLENGFSFEYSLGVPYLPGSSVKGLCRQVARHEHDDRTLRDLFGGADDETNPDARASVGDVVFYAAYPQAWPKLEVDIINCHYPRYYASAGKPPNLGPREDESPVPVFFLTVAKGTAFVFRVLSRSENQKNVSLAFDLLSNGLGELGIGAKTALGYGVMG